MNGQINLKDAVRRTIEFEAPNGKKYKLHDETAVLIVRPRGWHLEEKHLRINGRSMSGSLVDFSLYLFHNATELIARGTGPYFYLPKIENHLEARLWNDIFVFSQNELGIPQGTIKATVLMNYESMRQVLTAGVGIIFSVTSRNSIKIQSGYCRIEPKLRWKHRL